MERRSRWRTIGLRVLAGIVVVWLILGVGLFVRFRRDVREVEAGWRTEPWGEPYSLGDVYWPTPPRWQHLGGVGLSQRHLGPDGEESVSTSVLICSADDPEELLERYERFLEGQDFFVVRPREDRLVIEAKRPGATASVRIGRPTWLGYRELLLSAQGKLREP